MTNYTIGGSHSFGREYTDKPKVCCMVLGSPPHGLSSAKKVAPEMSNAKKLLLEAPKQPKENEQ